MPCRHSRVDPVMTLPTSISHSVPALKLFRRYRVRSPSIAGPYVSIGDCLEPWISDGGMTWLDSGLTAHAGDLVMIDHDGEPRVKQLEQLPDGSWWLISNV